MVAILQKNIETVTNNDPVRLFGLDENDRAAFADAERLAELVASQPPPVRANVALAVEPDTPAGQSSIIEDSAVALQIRKRSASSAAIALNPMAAAGEISTVSAFRDVNTSAESRVVLYRGDGTANYPIAKFSTSSNNYVAALGSSKDGPNFAIGAEGSINQYKLLVSRVDYMATDPDNEHNHLIEVANDGQHSSVHEGPIVDLIRGGNPSNRLTPDVNLPAAGNLIGCLRLTGRTTSYAAVRYAGFHGEIVNATDAAYEGLVRIKTGVAASYGTRLTVGRGVFTPQAPLGDPGQGNIAGVRVFTKELNLTSSTEVAWKLHPDRDDVSTDALVIRREAASGTGNQNVMTFANDGNVSVVQGFSAASLLATGDTLRVATAKTPASASASGSAGQIAWDANYIYVCIGTNIWKRSALTTW